MDLAELDTTKKQEEGVPVEITHLKTRAPIGLTIKVAGYDSERVKKVQRDAADDAAKAGRQTNYAEQLEESVILRVVAAVVGWTFKDLTIDGKVPECTPHEVRKLFKRFPDIAEQVNTVAQNRVNFLPG